MKQFLLKARGTRFLFLALLGLGVGSTGLASVALPPGSGPTVMVGSTSAAEADLGGTVIHDQLIPFKIVGAGGAVLYAGNLQNRVVKSTRTGDLHFYYRVRDTKGGLNGVIDAVRTHGFQQFPKIMADWRPDGLGVIHPHTVERSPGAGAFITFNFPPYGSLIMSSGAESKFFYLKTLAKKFTLNGHTMIHLKTGQMAHLQTAMPQL